MLTFKIENVKTIDGQMDLRIDGHCLSTDTKPTNFANGSMLIEMDTSKIYFFNKVSETWVEFDGGTSV